jgi:spore germination cell wall hydrolase CwlJ-like protein
VSAAFRSRKGARSSSRIRSGSHDLVFLARAIAPWCLAAGVLASFSANAAYGPQTLEPPLSLIPNSVSETLLTEAQRLGIEPAIDVPLMQRGIIELLHHPGQLLYTNDPDALPPSRFVFGALQQPQAGSFQAVGNGFHGLTPLASGEATGSMGGGESPEQLYELTMTSPDGGTPMGGRAIELASMTPAPLEPEILALPAIAVVMAPAEVAIGPAEEEGEGLSKATAEDFTAGDPDLKDTEELPSTGRLADQPDYAALISPKAAKRELKCLAEAIYFEARSESEAGQIAVAQVVLNRVKSKLYPNTICGVVYQNRHRYMACQFSFACEGKKLRITEPGPWRQAVRLSKAVLGGAEYDKEVAGATHYHATYVRPKWAKKLRRMDKVGTHIFYKLRPGQT